jgi:hypothetical protein
MWEEVRARSVIINCCAFVSFMIVIPEGNLWLATTTTIEYLLAYQKKSSLVDLVVPPYL